MKFLSMFSGGKDSISLAHYLDSIGKLESVVFLDTGIRTPDVLPFVEDVTREFNWRLEVFKTPYRYEDLILQYGFPGPKGHNLIMTYLKGRGIRELRRKHKNPLLASGVRLDESTRRFRNTRERGIWEGAIIYAPIWLWPTTHVWGYVKENKLPLSPAYKSLHISGDCLCGAFADEGERDLLRAFYPDLVNRIGLIEDGAKRKVAAHEAKYRSKRCLWGWAKSREGDPGFGCFDCAANPPSNT